MQFGSIEIDINSDNKTISFNMKYGGAVTYMSDITQEQIYNLVDFLNDLVISDDINKNYSIRE